MRLALMLSLSATLIAFSAPTVASAEPYPDGSWQTSCTDARMNGDRLSATCQASNGGYRRSSIRVSDCSSGLVGNNNGRLFCEGGRENYEPNLPGGSWRSSCSDARMFGDEVRARCQVGGGGMRNAGFNMRNCPGWALGNSNGFLFCESGNTGFHGSFPGGSWQNSCRSATTNGEVLRAACSDGNGNYRWSAINVRNCPARLVGNDNGRLFCER